MAAVAPKLEEPMLDDSRHAAPNHAATNTTPTPANAQPPPPADTPQKDVSMIDAPNDQASPAPPRTATPAHGSRAASVYPDSGPAMPSEAIPHGDPTRRYLNSKVTAVLLEGMKKLAKEQPPDPLRVLGEYLLQKSKDLEGAS
ncbi:hypothetical protein CDD82_4814 [Ophiocordyceps australis]|uniref:Uncharacterized protein n=1 Tax=Ophiocordyceps australis TaxID=1399860 RepID=A0A2C5Z5P9_9HYPO|nr:hypothetical protein CDD82_4814 [Ophiocordyceps australis]